MAEEEYRRQRILASPRAERRSVLARIGGVELHEVKVRCTRNDVREDFSNGDIARGQCDLKSESCTHVISA
ncbi:uncharacterized protein PHACADRAFT_259259 [Phanerochaete carnosa HHB-10118-sp]|uniref:Uncharacterized protein n=1 Tax=Phanerochaete carnosa (strain HHB-10118-sp) TaxID=650164 RepID=K5W2F8_PHACS|nr:uncharacterized protein PHACADRAFT_259259 [Phanerochaete carnosa HHB-10118-sp]EKM53094.1 hypothetical protein PHACADRAFT_259259 [Phanerochaete carnosa HHB-10118-sp]